MITTGIFQALTQNADIADLIGSKLYPVRLPKNYKDPCGVYRLQPAGSVNVLGGEDETQMDRIQLDWYARDYETTRRLIKLSRAVLVPKDGTPNAYPYQLPDGTGIMAVIVHGAEDESFEVGEGGYLYRALLDLEFTYISPS